MSLKFNKDKRDKLWAKLELDIQKAATKKDTRFRLKGKWKTFVRKQEGFKIYSVDVNWVKNNLSITFDDGGHGYVHEFIPLDEIWIANVHAKGCDCRKVRKDRKVSRRYFDSTVIHEITEFNEMKKGVSYWKAHQIAFQKEREAGLLKDPLVENYSADD